jgi:hypothetical protein
MGPTLPQLSHLVGIDARHNSLGRLADKVKAARESLRRVMPVPDDRVREVLGPILRRRLPVAVIGLAGLVIVVGGMVRLGRRMKRPAPGPVEKARHAVARMGPISWARLRQTVGGKSRTLRAGWPPRWLPRRMFVLR